MDKPRHHHLSDKEKYIRLFANHASLFFNFTRSLTQPSAGHSYSDTYRKLKYPSQETFENHVLKTAPPPAPAASSPANSPSLTVSVSPVPEHMRVFNPQINIFSVAKYNTLPICQSFVSERLNYEKSRRRGSKVHEKLPTSLLLRYDGAAKTHLLSAKLNECLPKGEPETIKLPPIVAEPKTKKKTDVQVFNDSCLSNCQYLFEKPLFMAMDNYVEEHRDQMVKALKQDQRILDKQTFKVQLEYSKARRTFESAEAEMKMRENMVSDVKHAIFLISHYNVENAKLHDHLNDLVNYKNFMDGLLKNSIVEKDDDGAFDEVIKSPDAISEEDLQDMFQKIHTQPMWVAQHYEKLEERCVGKIRDIEEEDRTIESLHKRIKSVKRETDSYYDNHSQLHKLNKTNAVLDQGLKHMKEKVKLLDDYLLIKRYVDLLEINPNDRQLGKAIHISEVLEYYKKKISDICSNCLQNWAHLGAVDVMEMIAAIENEVDDLYEKRIAIDRHSYVKFAGMLKIKRQREERIRLAQIQKKMHEQAMANIRMTSKEPFRKPPVCRKLMQRSKPPKQICTLQLGTTSQSETENTTFTLQ